MRVERIIVKILGTGHLSPSLAYKFNDKVVIGEDTEAFPEMKDFANGCDLLIHECSFPAGFNVLGHTTPNKLAKILEGCNVKTLVLTHLYTPAIDKEKEIINYIKNF